MKGFASTGLIGFLLGILASFSVWAVAWGVAAHSDVVLGATGSSTVFDVAYQGVNEPPEPAAGIPRALADLATRHHAAIIAVSTGDGRPEIVVSDPLGLVAWFPADARPNVAYPVKGSFSATPVGAGVFLPPGFEIGAPITGPPGAPEGIQYARLADGAPLPSGTWVLTTTDPAAAAELSALLHGQALRPRDSQTLPLLVFLVQDPLVVATGVFFALGLAAATVYWALLVRGSVATIRVRWACGAAPAALWRATANRGLPALPAGVAAGAGATAGVVRLAGASPLAAQDMITVAHGGVVGAGASATVFLVTVWFAQAAALRRIERA